MAALVDFTDCCLSVVGETVGFDTMVTVSVLGLIVIEPTWDGVVLLWLFAVTALRLTGVIVIPDARLNGIRFFPIVFSSLTDFTALIINDDGCCRDKDGDNCDDDCWFFINSDDCWLFSTDGDWGPFGTDCGLFSTEYECWLFGVDGNCWLFASNGVCWLFGTDGSRSFCCLFVCITVICFMLVLLFLNFFCCRIDGVNFCFGMSFTFCGTFDGNFLIIRPLFCLTLSFILPSLS